VRGWVSMSASGTAASASVTRTSGGSCSGWFRRLHKSSFHHDTTDSQSDSRLPSAAFSGADGTVRLGLSRQNLVKASLISPLQRHCSSSTAIRSAHCCLSYLSARRRGPARRLYSSTSPARTAFLHCSVMDCVAWDIHGCFACLRGPRTSRAAVSKANLQHVHSLSTEWDSVVVLVLQSAWETLQHNASLQLPSSYVIGELEILQSQKILHSHEPGETLDI